MSTDPQNSSQDPHRPIVCLVIGMAGSGKTTVLQALNAKLHLDSLSTSTIPSAGLPQAKKKAYIVNLDPAVTKLPYSPNIDIRDTVNYKEVMKQYNLGPNGGIMTSLNLFSTKFGDVLEILEARRSQNKYIFFDTPGQIEVFTWSASGSIITETLASLFPTVLLYIVDTSRTVNPTTFMSNMLYACSVLYKSRLPLVVVFNKIDINDHKFAVEWMNDFESFQSALNKETSFMSELTRSMNFVLDTFYKNLRTVGVSAIDGRGLDELLTTIEAAADDYKKHYEPRIKRAMDLRSKHKEEEKRWNMERLRKDLEQTGGNKVVAKARDKVRFDDPNLGEEEEFEDDNEEMELQGEDPEVTGQEANEYAAFMKYVNQKQTTKK